MSPQIQYARTHDGVSIAFWTMGAGEPPLIISPQLGWSHISLELRNPELMSWYEHLSSRRTIVRYDPRAQGHSDRNIDQISEVDLASDIEAVIERLGRPKVDLLGWAGLGPPTVRVAAEHPESVRRLVLADAILMGDRHYGSERLRAVRRLIDTDWDLFTRTFAHEKVGWSGGAAQVAEQWAAYIRAAVSPRDAALILDGLANIDWRAWLLKIRAPTLVLLSSAIRRNESEVRWADIADVRVRLIDMLRERALYQTDEARVAIDDFLDGGAGEAQPYVARGARDASSGTAVILFADVADSTALTERIGDAAFRERARALEAALRSAITDAGGTAVEGRLLGDGVLATFTSAKDAIDGALRCARAGDDCAMPLHLGLHAGDVIRERGDIHGGAVNIAARVSDAAAPGEILVSDIVRGLARTSAGMSFEDRGDHNLKGIADPIRLYAVRPHGG